MSPVVNIHYVIVILAMMLLSSSAIIYDDDLTMTSYYVGIAYKKFVFDEKGTFSFTYYGMEPNYSRGTPMMAVFSENLWLDHNPCKEPAIMNRAIVNASLTSNIVNVPMNCSIQSKTVYATILYCDSHEDVVFYFKAVFMNGDKHLSEEDRPFPYLYIVTVGLWGAFFIAWMLNWAFTRQITKLHLAISCFILIKIISVVYLMVYYLELDSVGKLDDAVVIGYYAVKIIELCAFFTVLLLIGAGWGMIDDKPPRGWMIIALLVVLYGVFFGLSLFFTLLGIASIVLLCVILYMVYYSATKSRLLLTSLIDQLTGTIKEAEKTDCNPETGVNVPLLKSELEHHNLQRAMLTRFCYIMMAYVIGRVIENFILLFVYLNWVDSLLTEILDVALFACIGWVFRLRQSKKQGMYFVLENEYEEYGVPMTDVTATPSGVPVVPSVAAAADAAYVDAGVDAPSS